MYKRWGFLPHFVVGWFTYQNPRAATIEIGLFGVNRFRLILNDWPHRSVGLARQTDQPDCFKYMLSLYYIVIMWGQVR